MSRSTCCSNLASFARVATPVLFVMSLAFGLEVWARAGDSGPPKTAGAKTVPKESQPASSRMTIRTLAAKTGQPLKGVTFEFHSWSGGKGRRTEMTSNDEGVVQFDWPRGTKLTNLWFTARSPGFIPIHYMWRNDQREIALPSQLELRFEPGVKIAGVVQDEAGNPIAGADVSFTMPLTWPRMQNWGFIAAELKTDKNGRWVWDGAPADLGNVNSNVTHRDYQRGNGGSVGLSTSNVFVLKRGLTVEGRVVDQKGSPVSGAKAAMGYDRFGTNEPEVRTSADGRFVLKNCKAGKTLVTVQAAGFAPTFQEIDVDKTTPPLEFKLEPGRILRIRVVDVQGKPIKGAFFATDTWRGRRTVMTRINTDADGMAVWHSAPADSVLCDILKQGYLSIRRKPLVASDKVQVITLAPQIVVSGKVVDGNTGQPINKFKLQRGRRFSGSPQVWWQGDEGLTFSDGSYRFKFDEPSDAGTVLRIIADGYRPATSRVFTTAEGSQTLDFTLWPGRGPRGILLLPNGEPAAGAEVAIVTREKRIWLQNGRLNRNQSQADTVTTDSQGNFSFPSQNGELFLIVAVHAAGYVDVLYNELDLSTKSPDRIKLRPWGRLKGRSLDGTKPDPVRTIQFSPQLSPRRRQFIEDWQVQYWTKTDRDGRFEFEHVIPGPGNLSRIVATRWGQYSTQTPGWTIPLELPEGKTVEATLGGSGRPVTGRVLIEGPAKERVDWSASWPATLTAKPAGPIKPGHPNPCYLGKFDATGRFRIPDVPAGNYSLSVRIQSSPRGNSPIGNDIGRAERTVALPPVAGGRSDEPFDLGNITIKVTEK